MCSESSFAVPLAALEADGVQNFQASWTELLDSVSKAMQARREARRVRGSQPRRRCGVVTDLTLDRAEYATHWGYGG
jgi:hypothetical protein